MSYVTNPAPPTPRRLWPRLLFPAIVIALCGGVISFPFLSSVFGTTSDEMTMFFMMAAWVAIPIGSLLLLIWWVFFAPVQWIVRFLLLFMLIVGVSAFLFFGVRKVEFTTNAAGMVPIFYFSWKPSDQQRLEQHQQNESDNNNLPPVDITIGAEDFARFRGPKTDGVVKHIKLETDWAKHPPKELWRRPAVEGYSGFAVAGNVAVTMEQRKNEECIVAYDRATGRQRWVYTCGVKYEDNMKMGDGPRATPTIHDGLIFAIGASGEVTCINSEGKAIWSRNMLKDGKAKNIEWGMTGSPLIVGNLVIAHAGVDKENPASSAVIAYDYKTGEKEWAVGNRAAGYASPQLVTLGKTQQILLFDAAGLVSYDVKGNELWQHEWRSKMDMNMIQPLVFGDDRVFITSELDNGCAMVKVTPQKPGEPWKVESVWKNKNLAGRFANPVTDGKNIYGLQFLNGVLRCLDVETGKLRWSGERYGPGQMLMVDNVLMIVSDTGEVSLLKTDTDAPEVLGRFNAFDDKTWNTPALAGDQLFLRNQHEIVCFKLTRR